MARPLRIQYEGAFYHVMARGNEKREIFHTREDREKFLEVLRLASERLGIIVHCYCLMLNHYHLLIETPRANISQAMHFINSFYATYFRRTRGDTGHLFQGRFKAIVIEKDEYLQVLSRYIHLNPVRAGLVLRPEGYEWSSYRCFIKAIKDEQPSFIDERTTLHYFAPDEEPARAKYKEYVSEGIGHKLEDPLRHTRDQSILGSDEFYERMRGA